MSVKIHHGQYVLIQSVIDLYKHDEPLHVFLKSFFKKHKQCGSRDRRLITQQVYNYYRLGNSCNDFDLRKRLAIAGFLIDDEPNEFITNDHSTDHSTLDSRIKIIENQFPEFKLKNIFTLYDELPDDIDEKLFIQSFLSRPKVWIRVKRGFEKLVEDDFNQSNIQFEISLQNKNAWSVNAESKLDATVSYKNGYFEIQDLSSQLTGNYFNPKPNESWWDCCCGSGGKSLLLVDKEPAINLLVTDIRQSILENLKQRFLKADIKNYKSEVLDLEDGNRKMEIGKFDFIIADVPCTGSGTLGETAEDNWFSSKENIATFQQKQISIVKNICNHLSPNGKLIYITCSVFKKENEDVCNFITSSTHLKLQQTIYIKGYDTHADTMFVAVLEN